MLQWPWTRFEAFYMAWMKREALEQIHTRKERIMAALWANPNYDSKEGQKARTQRIEQLEEHYKQAQRTLFGKPEEEPDLESNAFMRPALERSRQIARMKATGVLEAPSRIDPADIDIDQQ